MMKIKSLLATGLVGAAMLAANASYVAAAETATPAEQKQSIEIKLPYKYTSPAYGYTIMCPKKPNVVPAANFYGDPNKKGEVLVFDNVEYDVRYGWIFLEDAFSESSPDWNALSEADAESVLNEIMASNPYEAIRIMPMNDHNKCMYALTAKEIEFDTTGDGIPDTKATTDRQMVVTFFRGDDGGRYSMQLMDNPVLRELSVATFQAALTTFQTK